jgi:hypothetical protein
MFAYFTVECRPVTKYNSVETSVARQQIYNARQSTNLEEMFSLRSVRLLRNATEELLEVVFSLLFILRCYKQGKSILWLVSHMEAGWNTSTVALRVVGGDERSLESETVKYGHESQGTWVLE